MRFQCKKCFQEYTRGEAGAGPLEDQKDGEGACPSCGQLTRLNERLPDPEPAISIEPGIFSAAMPSAPEDAKESVGLQTHRYLENLFDLADASGRAPPKVISVIGSADSGKTWMVERAAWICSSGRTDRGLVPNGGEMLRNKEGSPGRMRIENAPLPGVDDVVFFDIAGEDFQNAIASSGVGVRPNSNALKEVIAAVYYADALVIAIDTKRMKNKETRSVKAYDDDAVKFMNAVDVIVRTIAEVKRLKGEFSGKRFEEFYGAYGEHLEAGYSFGEARALATPVAVLFSRADSEFSFKDGSLPDALVFARDTLQGGLIKLTSNFRHVTFRFTSAFAGQDQNSHKVNWALESYGVHEALEWVCRHMQPRRRVLRFLPHLPTRTLLRLRRLLGGRLAFDEGRP